MKKLIDKFGKRKSLPPSSRITTETVAEHREHILAGGRRFKYPVQYVRHKLVINAILISISAVIVAMAVAWWQLYPMQNTSEFMYRVTKVIPVPVATVDGQPVLYSDYLMKYLSSAHYLQQKEQVSLSTDNGKAQIEYIKQKSIQDAIADAYAVKLSQGLGLSVSKSELKSYLDAQRQSSNGEISEQTYSAVILDYYGWSQDEFSHIMTKKLLRQKVAYAIDKDALKTANMIDNIVKQDTKTDFNKLVASFKKQNSSSISYGNSGWLPKQNQDGGLSVEASKLKMNDVSSIIKSSLGEGYYIIRLLDTNDSQVKYEYIRIPLTTFDKSLASLDKQKKVNRYISIPEQSVPSALK